MKCGVFPKDIQMSSQNHNNYLKFYYSFVISYSWLNFIWNKFNEIDYIVIKIYDIMMAFSRGWFSKKGEKNSKNWNSKMMSIWDKVWLYMNGYVIFGGLN